MNSPLHVHYHYKNQRGFKNALEAARSGAPSGQASGQSSSSGPRSWRESFYGHQQTQHATSASDIVNARDHMGRTVLHLACSSLETADRPYLEMLLAHPLINVNAQDAESSWTPLHRALWAGNLYAAVQLMARSDIDFRLKDGDGYTPFDLYNESVEGTAPVYNDGSLKELYVWGNNRNASLGLGDDGDRVVPDQVELSRVSSDALGDKALARLRPLAFEGIFMSRLHTVAVTSGLCGNVRACGLGSSGRLGPGNLRNTQHRFVPLPHLDDLQIVSVALGQDHSLALTSDGEVYSWGLNRFHQLGYAVDQQVKEGKLVGDETIQPTARRVMGVLKMESVKGVTASKIASSCWTNSDVFTWGTNRGQLGYSKTTQPIQVTPRKVTPITLPVLHCSMSETALCILLISREVICFANGTNFRIVFPAQLFPNEIQPWFRPSKGLAGRHRTMEKITSNEDTFAGVSSSGDVFTWIIPSEEAPSSESSGAGSGFHYTSMIKPQRIWTSSKQYMSVKDVALGPDGTAILCVQSGAAYIRSRAVRSNTASSGLSSGSSVGPGKPFKFYRAPSLNRVINVCASPVGAFAALRADGRPSDIALSGNTIAQDLTRLLPFGATSGSASWDPSAEPSADQEDDDALTQTSVSKDTAMIKSICGYIREQRSEPEKHSDSEYARPALDDRRNPTYTALSGSDLLISAKGVTFPAYASVLAARCTVIRTLLMTGQTKQDGNITLSFGRAQSTLRYPRLQSELSFGGCEPFAIALLLQYLVTDDIAAIWDRQTASNSDQHWRPLNIKPAEILSGMQRLAKILDLPTLGRSLEGMYKSRLALTLSNSIARMFESAQGEDGLSKAGGHDLVLELADRRVFCHSAVLLVRSPFFATLLGDPEWTSKRWTNEGTLTLNMSHRAWAHMELVFRYIYCDDGEGMFENLSNITRVEDLLDHAFLVMAAACEFLLDPLVLVCSRIIFRHVNVHNACTVLRDATTLDAQKLVETVQHYMTTNLELFLEGGQLQELPSSALGDLAKYLQSQQTRKYPITRSSQLLSDALVRWKEWVSVQDIPEQYPTRNVTNISRLSRPPPKVALSKLSAASASDQTPAFDIPLPIEDTPHTPTNPHRHTISTSPSSPWKGKGVAISLEKSDLRAIMKSEREAADALVSTKTPPRVVGFIIPTSESPETLRWTPTPATLSRRQSQQAMELQTPSSPSRSSSSKGSSWKIPPQPAASSIASISAEALQGRAAPHGPLVAAAAPSQLSGLSRALKTDITSLGVGHPRPITGLGPTITPTRSTSSGPVPIISRKKSSGGDAWTRPPEPSTPSHHGTSSILDIQRQERARIEELQAPKKTLAQIQADEEERRVAEDFEKWWAIEEARVKAEEAMIAAAMAMSSGAGESSRSARDGTVRRGRGRPKQSSAKSSHARPQNGEGRVGVDGKQHADGNGHSQPTNAIPIVEQRRQRETRW